MTERQRMIQRDRETNREGETDRERETDGDRETGRQTNRPSENHGSRSYQCNAML